VQHKMNIRDQPRCKGNVTVLWCVEERTSSKQPGRCQETVSCPSSAFMCSCGGDTAVLSSPAFPSKFITSVYHRKTCLLLSTRPAPGSVCEESLSHKWLTTFARGTSSVASRVKSTCWLEAGSILYVICDADSALDMFAVAAASTTAILIGMAGPRRAHEHFFHKTPPSTTPSRASSTRVPWGISTAPSSPDDQCALCALTSIH
jgi:hypothetical protein